MEKRVLIAIVLSVAILVAWQVLFSPPPSQAPPRGGQEPSARPPGPSPAATPGPASIEGATPIPRLSPPPPAAVAERPAEVDTPLYRVTFGRDGTVTAWVLHYRGSKPLILGGALGPLTVGFGRPGRPSEVVSLSPAAERLELSARHPTGTLAFRGATADGLRIERRLTFRADSYRIDVELDAARSRAGVEPGTLVLYWTTPVAVPGATREAPWLTFGQTTDHRQLLGRILVAENGRPSHFEAPPPALKDPKESPNGPELKDPQLVPVSSPSPAPRWVALEDDYFIAALIPSGATRALRGRERDVAVVGVEFSQVSPEPGRPWEGKAALYVGPKEWDRLAALGIGLEQAQARNYGDFLWTLPMEWFCVPLLWLMNFFATRVPGQNYGVAIILLTVLVKIAFYPLAQKSMSSMKKMQTLQPQLNALRSKYKSDPQRFQREQMDLYRKHKVNPMGGCLPMVVQIPIFYALYLTLQYSVELQGAPFVLWITDLSKKDPIYVLPVLMGVSMLVQQKMTPTVGDPRQARIMLIMPVIFTFMFLEFPTGLVLYWLVNNVLSIAQQYLIDRAALRAKGAPPVAPVEGKAEREGRKAEPTVRRAGKRS
ncbi:MAG: membrane protein insertase YidC [Candidatus Rokubacteria bacterium]|nr:membrane protein insertase YidC [Candidatus Rokubacteria bacterium]